MDQTTSTEVRYGGFWRRAAARFIDGLIVAIGLIVLNIILGLAVGNKSPAVSIIDIILGWGYFCYMTKEFGATYGKKALGIEVKMDSGEPLTWGAVILRETVGKIASAIILCIGYIMVAFTPKKRGLHDYIGSTVVVYKDSNKRSVGLVWTLNIIQTVIVVLAIVAGIAFAKFFAGSMTVLPGQFNQPGGVQFKFTDQDMQKLIQQYSASTSSGTPAK